MKDASGASDVGTPEAPAVRTQSAASGSEMVMLPSAIEPLLETVIRKVGVPPTLTACVSVPSSACFLIVTRALEVDRTAFCQRYESPLVESCSCIEVDPEASGRDWLRASTLALKNCPVPLPAYRTEPSAVDTPKLFVWLSPLALLSGVKAPLVPGR